jgi:hypothetical protein
MISQAVIRLATDDPVRSLNQKMTTIYVSCPHCGAALATPGSVCGKCKRVVRFYRCGFFFVYSFIFSFFSLCPCDQILLCDISYQMKLTKRVVDASCLLVICRLPNVHCANSLFMVRMFGAKGVGMGVTWRIYVHGTYLPNNYPLIRLPNCLLVRCLRLFQPIPSLLFSGGARHYSF